MSLRSPDIPGLPTSAPRRRPRLAAFLLLPALLLAVSCTSTPDRSMPSPFADCADLTTPLPNPTNPLDGTASEISDPVPAGTAEALPALELACFTGGARVSLREVRGPAVINLWASWCPPCRKELPAFQRLADRADDQVRVIGVNSLDDRPVAQSLAEDFGLTFPTLEDPDGTLRKKLELAVLPLTLFVDGHGNLRHLDKTGALDDEELADLIEKHLGVTVR